MVDKGIPIRLVLYTVAILYVAVDLFVIAGPLRRAVFRKNLNSEEVIEAAKDAGVVARVYFQPILLSQVDRRVEENLWTQGRSLDGLPREERIMLRRAALDDLIDLHLLRLKIRFNQEKVPVEDEEIEAELQRFTKRFPSQKEFVASLKRHGWSEKELRFRLAARLQQEKYLAAMIEVTVGEDEARVWFGENKEKLALPERLRARHIFLATLNRDPEQVRTRLEDVKRRLEAREAGFADLAAEVSEDPRTKAQGGDLGWMQAGRLPADFAASVFGLAVGAPALVRTKIGWHLVEVLEKKPPTERTFEEAREEVAAALEAVKRDQGLKLYRQNLRERDKHNVEVFLDVLENTVQTSRLELTK